MASRSSVAIKTALAKKYAGKQAVEQENIKSMALGYAGLLPDSVKSAIKDSHDRINNRREYLLKQIDVLATKLQDGDYTVIPEITRITNLIPDMV